MGSWIIDVGQLTIALLAMAFILYKLVFSSREAARREMALRPRPPFERREAEHVDRRRQNLGSPTGTERRQGPRRTI